MVICCIGGCLNRQKNLPRKQHYYSVLSEKLYGAMQQHPSIRLGKYQSYINLVDQLKSHIEERPDVMVLFLRAFPLHSMIKPLIRYENLERKQRLLLHPALAGSTLPNDVMDEFADDEVERFKKPKPVVHRALAAMNNRAGKVLGLDIWALKYIEQQVIQIHEECLRWGIKLILTGPPAYPTNKFINEMCFKLNAMMDSLSVSLEIGHCHIIGREREVNGPLMEPDGIHVSSYGHLLLANGIYHSIMSW